MTDPLLTCSMSDACCWVELRLAGEADVSTAPILRDALARGVGSGASVVVVDAAELTYLDSSGLSCLAAACKDAADAGSRLVLRHPTAIVRRVLEITELDTLLLDAAFDEHQHVGQ
jgi:anti-anti-sigma factor